jgi:hypothetical protein
MSLTGPLQRLFQDIFRNKPNESSILIYATCVCCAIEALGKFILGGSGTKQANFKAFAGRMHADIMSQCLGSKTYCDILWHYFRNGLAHGLAICHGGFEHQATYFSVKKVCGVDCLYIDPAHFNADFRNALAKYEKQLTAAPVSAPLRVAFERVFDDVFVYGR